MKRQPGYYRVIIESQELIAYYNQDGWSIPGSPYLIPERKVKVKGKAGKLKGYLTLAKLFFQIVGTSPKRIWASIKVALWLKKLSKENPL